LKKTIERLSLSLLMQELAPVTERFSYGSWGRSNDEDAGRNGDFGSAAPEMVES
jgi:hypothetical protein